MAFKLAGSPPFLGGRGLASAAISPAWNPIMMCPEVGAVIQNHLSESTDTCFVTCILAGGPCQNGEGKVSRL